MDKWEYRLGYIANLGGKEMTSDDRYVWEVIIEEQMNELGKEGWELVQFPAGVISGLCADGYAVFKRKIVKEQNNGKRTS